MPPLPHTTPHTLRRTYISIALLANNFDVKWVMDQVGHADSKMTMDVYAQLEQRAKRDHGARFDELVRRAKKELSDRPKVHLAESSGTATGTGAPKSPISPADPAPPEKSKPGDLQAEDEVARPGLEPGIPDLFSRVLYQLSYLAESPANQPILRLPRGGQNGFWAHFWAHPRRRTYS